MRFRGRAVAAALILLLLSVGGLATGARAAVRRPAEPLTVSLSGYRGPEAAGLFMADARGYFSAAGLRVDLYKPWTPLRPIRYVVEGIDDLGVSYQPQVVLAREEGEPVEVVGGLIARPTATLIWPKGSEIRRLADLKGKIIGVPGLSFQERFLLSALNRVGLNRGDVCIRASGYGLASALRDGEADAVFGGSKAVEGRIIASGGSRPVVKPVTAMGIPDYEELVIVARSDFAADHREALRAFMAAVRRGTAAALRDPGAAARAMAPSTEANPRLTVRQIQSGVEAMAPVYSRSGIVDPAQARRLTGWMREEGILEREPPLSVLASNEFVARP